MNRRFSAAVRAFSAIAVVAAVVFAVVATASARPTQNINAKVKVLATGVTEFSGRVTSTDPECIDGRKVKISVPKQTLGNVKTDKEGRFFITRPSVRSGAEVTFDLKARGVTCIPLVATLISP